MANDISSVPWVLDTASATPIINSRAKIKDVYWVNPINIGDTFVIQTPGGKTILSGRCEVANQSQIFNLNNWYNGLVLTTLGSGTLEVHIL